MINYPVIVVGRIHDHEPYRSIFGRRLFSSDRSIGSIFSRFVSWKSPEKPICHGKKRKIRSLWASSKSTRAFKQGSATVSFRFPVRPIPRSKLFLERKYRIFQKMYPSWDISNSPKYLFFHTRKEKFKSVSQIRFIEYKIERAIEFLIIGENKIPITVVERNLRTKRSGSSLIGQRFSSLLPDRETEQNCRSTKDIPWLFHWNNNRVNWVN